VKPARQAVLSRVRMGLGRQERSVLPPLPASARAVPRESRGAAEELELLLAEIQLLGGKVRRIGSRESLRAGLVELVAGEKIQQAVLWRTAQLQALGIESLLEELGVKTVPEEASSQDIAGCELGVSGVDAALAETGTLVLGSGGGRVRTASLLPRVHLALLEAGCLRADLAHALVEAGSDRCLTLVSGPSRTSDIELTLTIGVHGPKALYVWVLQMDEKGEGL
jgi:L-lactate dehydrogenase complex protein LldG